MTTTTTSLICVAIAYLAGSIPFGFLIAKFVADIDIRTAGSGNIGATNVGRVVGAKWGIAVLVLDCLKGLLPVWLLPQLLFDSSSSNALNLAVACGVMTIVGHMYPCWLKLRGGKGVATALGVVMVLAPWGTLAAVTTFALTLFVARIVSLSSIIAAVAFAVCQMIVLWPHIQEAELRSRVAFSLAIPLLIIFRHRGNIGRIIRGEEPRFRAKADDATANESTSD